MAPAPDQALLVSDVKDVNAESFGLRYADQLDEETVLCKDVVAIIPAPESDAAASVLLFIKPVWAGSGPAATGALNGRANGDAPELNGDHAAAANGDASAASALTTSAFVDRLAARRLPPPCAAALARFVITHRPDYLDVTGGRQVHVIVSTKSGVCDAEAFFTGVVQPALGHMGLTADTDYTLHRTTSERTILDLAANTLGPRANHGVPQTILLLSGDGGAIDIINGIAVIARGPQYTPPVIGVLPLGTGNALANSSGLNHDSTRGLSSFLRGRPRPLPAFRARFSPGSEIMSNEGRSAHAIPVHDAAGVGTLYGVVVASWGLHASLVADSDTSEYRQYGAERFSMAARSLLYPDDGSEPHLYQGQVTLRQSAGAGGAEYNVNWDRQDHVYLLATFVSNLEKSLTISPRSQPLDGVLRLLHFGKLPSADIASIFGLAYEGGKHTELDVVGYEAIEGFRIDFHEPDARWRRACVDGKIVRVNADGWMEVSKVADEFVMLVTDA